MTRILGVELGEEIVSAFHGKHDRLPDAPVSRKKNKVDVSIASKEIGFSREIMDMELQFSLHISMDDYTNGCVAGPSLPPGDQ